MSSMSGGPRMDSLKGRWGAEWREICRAIAGTYHEIQGRLSGFEVPNSCPLLQRPWREYAPRHQQGRLLVVNTRHRGDCAGCRFLRCVQGQGQRPEAITMPIPIPFTSKSDVSGTGHFPANSAKISPDGVCERHLDRAIFKSYAHRISEFLFGAACEIHTFDPVGAKALRATFGKLPAETGPVDAAASNRR